MTNHPRVLLTKSFIDSHDRAIKTMEVVLVDYETPADIVSIAVDEDVDVIGISFMSGGQVDTTTEVMRLLAERGAAEIPVVLGGTIRPFDVPPLTEAGVATIFRGGEKLATISARFRELADARRASHA